MRCEVSIASSSVDMAKSASSGAVSNFGNCALGAIDLMSAMQTAVPVSPMQDLPDLERVRAEARALGRETVVHLILLEGRS
jgi:hypothetical protein